MPYDPEQKKVIDRIVAIGRKRKVPREHILAALEVGAVESGYRNLPGGDRDSQGFRQERRSLYPNPRNLTASVNRLYDEMAQLDRGQKTGELAADVQRPAEQYRGRYQERLGEAQAILGETGAAAPKAPKTAPAGGDRRALLASYLLQRGKPDALLELAAGLQGSDEPGVVAKPKRKTSTASPGRLKELFYQGAGGLNVKNGTPVPQGYVSGHTDHVHVATGPKDAVKLGRLAQRMGLTVRENPAFDPVDPVHTESSYHYSNRAIDVSGDPKLMRKFAKRVARMYGVR